VGGSVGSGVGSIVGSFESVGSVVGAGMQSSSEVEPFPRVQSRSLGQAVQALLPTFVAYVPGAHSEHVLELTAEYEPASQLLQPLLSA
jgi:hypothetical protein